MPPGYRLELVASEPLVQDPIAIDWDRGGPPLGRRDARLRAESHGARAEHEPIGRIVVLEDTDRRRRDGQAHGVRRRPGPAAGAQGPRPRRAGRRAAERLADARHERRSRRRTRRSWSPSATAAARRDVEQNANGFYWALDNWIHTADADMYLRFEERQVRGAPDAVARRVGRHPGRRRPHLPEHERVGAARGLRADAVLRAQPEPAPHPRQLRSAPRRRQRASTSSGRCGRIRAPTAPISRASIARTARSRRSPRSARRTVYRGDRLPAELYGNVFVAEPAANLVSRIVARGRRHDACGRGRPTSEGSSSPPPTSASGRSSCPTRPTARSTSSTCTAASSSTAPTSPNICAITSSTASSNSRSGWAASTASCTRRTRRDTTSAAAQRHRRAAGRAPVASERLVARHRAAAARRARRQVSGAER